MKISVVGKKKKPKPSGKLDTQMFPECVGTPQSRDVVRKNRELKRAATRAQAIRAGAALDGDRIVLYRGTDVAGLDASDLRYGDFLSASEKGEDSTGNAGADSYGRHVERYLLPLAHVEVVNGEFQYRGPSKSLTGGKKYPLAIYRAYNDAMGSNYTAAEIDSEPDEEVRSIARMAMPNGGGREEFDAALAEFRGSKG